MTYFYIVCHSVGFRFEPFGDMYLDCARLLLSTTWWYLDCARLLLPTTWWYYNSSQVKIMLGLNFIDIGQGVGGNLHQTKHFMVEMAFTKQSRR